MIHAQLPSVVALAGIPRRHPHPAKPLTIIVSFDVGEQVVPGAIPGWLASQVHEFGFQSAEATFNRGVIPAISLPAHGLDHPGGAENLAVIGGGVLAAAI